jgi:hypothetical protein
MKVALQQNDQRRANTLRWIVAGVMSVACGVALAQNDPCRAEVLKFEKGMGFVRQSVGEVQGKAIREKLLPSKLEFEILQKDGYCGLARYLREKKLDR